MDSQAVTIGELAAQAGVGVETVRYYQRRRLIEEPSRADGYRRYGNAALARLLFIKRAQTLGFTLDEIAELLQLQDGTDRTSIRRIASARLTQLRERIVDMQRMALMLEHLIEHCAHTRAAPKCPIIESIANNGDAVPLAAPAAARKAGRSRRSAARVS